MSTGPVSKLLDDGYFMVSYDLPLENPHAVLPVLQRPSNTNGEPAVLQSRASTIGEHANRHLSRSASPSADAMPMSIKTDATEFEESASVSLKFELENAEFESIDVDEFRKQTLKKMIQLNVPNTLSSAELRRAAIYKTSHVVVSYVWFSKMEPDILEIPAPSNWNATVDDRVAALLFLIWPQEESSQIWLYCGSLGRWESVQIGDEFIKDAAGWKKVESTGEYVLQIKEHVARLHRKVRATR
ncbi:hypothetical protein C8F04DRAFT_1190535 [Mycena alexandri]|uniref:Uncharacterized protein n=1 Tax=Mycena alexandri TaxID=1745969 RepID=A0AAD6WTE2_9AGAR|nr:hypothetical protein C8F04DRAFT_1190535 [Mycena alexandri]